MTLKFDVSEDMGGYALFVDTAQTNIEVGATDGELRRLLIDLIHEFGHETKYDRLLAQTQASLASFRGEADELRNRDDVDPHMSDVIEGLEYAAEELVATIDELESDPNRVQSNE